MSLAIPTCQLIEAATAALIDRAVQDRAEADSPFSAARRIVTRLGAHVVNGRAEIGYWVPERVEQAIPPDQVWLEILTPLEPLDFALPQQTLRFHRQHIQLMPDGEFLWGVIDGMIPGSRDVIGSLYWLKYRDRDGQYHTITDPLAHSIPFGVFAPSELYDMPRLQAERTDRDHFTRLDTEPDPDGVPRVRPPTNILQIHPATASREGTLAGLTRIYREIAAKQRAGEPLSPADTNYVGYDAVQLMPIEPTIEYEDQRAFWQEAAADPLADTVTVRVGNPNMTNWGYDVVLCASPAVNPAVLGTHRPDELVDFIAALHNMPDGPVKVMFDIVYGHLDNQALPLLNQRWFAGANMYGQNVNFRDPVVRATLLEMQRRKHNYGVDGIRVDGAQDFKNYNAEQNIMEHDDEHLLEMNNVELDVAGVRYRPWMIFEDGRPWPRDDWELSSTYREVTKIAPNVFQWGPLTFAHNTPFLFTFWITKWWRIVEMSRFGREWITGCANHDTLRRGTQVDTQARINTYLGDTLPDIFANAYDNPAAKLFDYAAMPGVPMDFINASMRAPWSFIRNTDERYGVKVVSEEARFLHWVVNEERFQRGEMFPRLKNMGFDDLGELRRFLHSLDHFMQATDYDIPATARLLSSVDPLLPAAPYNIAKLKTIARAWMDDVHDFCNVAYYRDRVEPQRAEYNRRVRAFRRARPWLMDNLRDDDHFTYLHPVDGSVVFTCWRHAPDDTEQVLFVANMEGAPRTVTPAELPIPGLPLHGWEVALVTPGLSVAGIDAPLALRDSEGVVFTRG